MDMKIRLFCFFAVLTVLFQSTFSMECEKCNIAILDSLNQSIDKPDYKTVKDFVCTFDSSCLSNVEFSEWGNELLFLLVEKQIHLLNKALHDLGMKYVELICNQLENPISDSIDLQKVYKQIITYQGDFPKDMVHLEKIAIEKAATKSGIKLKK